MAIKPEAIRKAKKFLENKKLSIKIIKPRLFAQASEENKKSFDDLLIDLREKVVYGETDTGNKETN